MRARVDSPGIWNNHAGMTTDFLLSRSPPLLSPASALLLDFDGTLVELASHPDAVSPSSELAGWLYQLEKYLGNALAIVTGRPLRDIDRLLKPLRLMGAGTHGAELRLAMGGEIRPTIEPLPARHRTILLELVAGLEGVWVEDKVYALAVHYRRNPDAASACHSSARQVQKMDADLDVVPGHAVVELRRKGSGKGAAIQSLLRHPVFMRRAPVFVGDDVADEEGFLAVQAAGGFGIKVGAGPTQARHRLADAAAVHDWLHESLLQLKAIP